MLYAGIFLFYQDNKVSRGVPMKKWILFVVVLGMLGWAIYDFIDSKENNADQFKNAEEVQVGETEIENEKGEETEVGLDIGNVAPDFELETLDGDMVKLSDFRGNKVMINFWATWCPPCRAEMPDMERFHQDKDIVILAVNLTDTENSIKNIENFANEFNLTFPILLDKDLIASALYAIKPIPTTYMVDSKGYISFRAFGPMNYDMMVQKFEKMD